MSEKSHQRATRAHSEERRRFLKTAGLAGSSAAAAAALPGIVVAAPEAEETGTEARGAGYRESAHVRDYYRIASE